MPTDHMGFNTREPISDRECILKSLENCVNLAGLDKKQVERLIKEFAVEKTVEQMQSEYPPL